MKEHFGPALERVNVVAKENPSPEELEQKLDEELKSVPLSDTETLADMIAEALSPARLREAEGNYSYFDLTN